MTFPESVRAYQDRVGSMPKDVLRSVTVTGNEAELQTALLDAPKNAKQISDWSKFVKSHVTE
ncbi:hypothetical protein GYB61_12565 [bacterium]|nr:hypothetical protein [bacterium]